MSDFNYLKLYSFGRLTIFDRVQPVDKINPTIFNLLKEPEYTISINLIDAIDHFIYEGLKRTPTLVYLNELIAQAYQRYSFAKALKLDIHSDSQFKVFCQKRYHNEGQTVKIAGIVVKLVGIDILT